MQAALDALPRQIALLDVVDGGDGPGPQLRLAWVNARVLELTGLRLDQVVGRRLRDVFPAVGAHLAGHYLEVARTGRSYSTVVDPFDGRYVQGAMQITAVAWMAGGVLVEVEDVTDRRRAEAALAASQRRLELAQEMAGIAVWSLDVTGGEFIWSPRLRRLLGATDDQQPSFELMLHRIHPDDRDACRGAYRHLVATGEPLALEHRIVAGDGGPRWVRAWALAEHDQRGRLQRVEGSMQEITEQRHREAALLREVRLDPLTGLANRRGWALSAPAAAAAALDRGRPVAVAMIDIDHFKAVNDTGGHQAGDRLLVACAAAWRKVVRDGDVLARVGGEEFALLLAGCDPLEAGRTVERLRVATPAPATVSIGVTGWGPGDDLVSTVGRADRGLYMAKAAGRDRVVRA